MSVKEYKQQHLNELLDRVDNCLTLVAEIREENDMLIDENHKMAKFLLKDGYTTDDVDNIAMGFDIDTGAI